MHLKLYSRAWLRVAAVYVCNLRQIWIIVHLFIGILVFWSLVVFFFLDIEAQILEIQGMKAALVEGAEEGVGLDSTGYYDQEIYGGSDSRFAGYVTSIAANEQEDVSGSIIL